ncbi:MAG: cation diffusion facilitator family transporter [Thermodesulfovibrionaceae bacterium]
MLNLYDRKREIQKVLLITLFLNLSVSFVKIIYGWLSNSVAIYSDGFHSLFDGVSNIGGLIALKLSTHPPDKEHPYGHRKFETVFAVFIGVMMAIVAIEILRNAYEAFFKSEKPELDNNAFIILICTLAVNLFISTYERKKGKELKSEFLIADSAHTRADIYTTLGVLLSVVITKLGYTIVDPIAGLIVGGFIAKEAFKILKEATDILADKAVIDKEKISEVVSECYDVIECKDIRTRGATGHIFVDLKILVDSSISVSQAHEIANRVENLLKDKFPDIVDVVIHIEPSEKTKDFPQNSKD